MTETEETGSSRASEAARGLRLEELRRDHHRGSRVIEHESQAVGRIGWVQRQVGAAGLQDCQEHNRELDRPIQPARDQHLRPDAHRLEAVSEPVRSLVQLPVVELLAAHDNGRRARRRRSLLGHQFVGAPPL